MQCPYPRQRVTGSRRFNIKVDGYPCGKCEICLANRQRDWYVRLLSELGYTQESYFVTLTYDEEHLPENGELKKRDVQLFLKRFRDTHPDVVFAYYLCGEYGSTTMRPHYHMIFFVYAGSMEDVSHSIRDSWKLGNIHLGTVEPESINYCLGYVKKQILYHYIDGKQKPYQVMSKRIGMRYMLENIDTLEKNVCVYIKGNRYPLPRYWRKKSLRLRIAHEQLMLSVEDKEEKKRSIAVRKPNDYPRDSDFRKGEQINLNIKRRKDLSMRNKKF